MKVLFDKECSKSFYKVVDLSIDENNTMYLTVKSNKTGKAIKQYIFTNVVPTIVGDIELNNNSSINYSFIALN